ncbi:hypothetical protein [Curtobacterium sp. VKM Ac-2922]|uniref:hypothetical protein n=1 Tax=Curtobacterium sp. VKM Ac-2922 TaxID=2929475 RepID=UPI001FB2E197|nr:hypothetical protein [Curtobacterium sp. VKM Ac-2922]MCJ1712979.1 hypothetical protein [Curtobacterium sp. VKM Ac-2922]
MSDIRLDAATTERRGAPRESLARVAAAQRYPTGGVSITQGSWEALWRARKGRFFRVKSSSPEFDELRSVELITDAGAPTPTADEFLQTREATVISLGAEAQSGGVTSKWSCWMAPDRVVIAAGPQLLEPELPTDQRVTLTVTTESFALGLLVSWMGIGPTWTFDHRDGPSAYPRDAVAARIAADRAIPPAPVPTSWSVGRAWPEGRWTEFVFGVPRTGIGQKLIRAGDLDWFRPENRDGGLVELHTSATNDVMREVLAVYRQSIDRLVRR